MQDGSHQILPLKGKWLGLKNALAGLNESALARLGHNPFIAKLACQIDHAQAGI